MTYRYSGVDPTVCDVTSSIELHMLNGTNTEIAIPCSYVIDGALVPIHLKDEGYTEPVMAVDVAVPGFTWSVRIDPDDDSVIKLVLNAACPSAVDVDVMIDSAVLITRLAEDSTKRTDAVIRGPIVIVASPLPL